jgi:hypothetical protein
MRRWARIGIGAVLLAVSGILLGVLGSAYRSSRGTASFAFHFLADRERLHHSVQETSSGKETVVAYCFPAYHDTVCDAAATELRALGYTEITPPIDYSSAGYRFDPRDRKLTTVFLKRGRTPTTISIGTGRFLEERSDGNLSFSNELDWVNVVIRQTQPRFSLRRELRYWLDRLSWWRARQRAAPTPRPGPG